MPRDEGGRSHELRGDACRLRPGGRGLRGGVRARSRDQLRLRAAARTPICAPRHRARRRGDLPLLRLQPSRPSSRRLRDPGHAEPARRTCRALGHLPPHQRPLIPISDHGSSACGRLPSGAARLPARPSCRNPRRFLIGKADGIRPNPLRCKRFGEIQCVMAPEWYNNRS